MVDWADRAQAREERNREQALKARLANLRPCGPSLTHCTDCQSAIPTKRQAFGGVSRCMPCQSTFEQGNR
jgi:phage/conjugal plasmid C-4 type zinc finger TraR family protein